jgi:uncharacterized repeat protein (TIGR02543 family)
MKKIVLVLTLVLSFMVGLLIIPGTVSAATEMVDLVPINAPLEIKAGDVLHFTRTATAYNNVTYTEYFRNDPAEATIWGFSSTGTGHTIRYNGTSVRLEGGTWDNHSFIAAFTDAWVDWSFDGNIGTLEFLQDWPTPIVGLYRSTSMTTPVTSWLNTTNISTFAVLEQTITAEEPTGLLPSDYGFVISVLGSAVLVDDLFEMVQIGDTLQLKSVGGTDVIENGINYINIYTVLESTTNAISISYGDGLQLFNSTVYERFSGAEGTTVRIDYTFESLAPEVTITDLGTSLREVKIYDGITLLETYTDLSYAMGGTWIAVVIEDIYERTAVTFMNELVEFATESVIEGSLVANPGIPVKAGFVFVGWETVAGHIWDFNNDVATGATLELTAKYVAEGTVLNTISFVTNGGTAVSDLLVEDDTIAVAPTAPTRTGYTFTGWYSDLALTTVFSFIETAVTADITLYAKWTPITNGGIITPPATVGLTTVQIVALSFGGLVVVAAFFLPEKKKVGSKR